MKIEDNSFEEVVHADVPKRRLGRTVMNAGDVYMFRCYDGSHYAKMVVLEILDGAERIAAAKREARPQGAAPRH